jgi:hypothetical protein
MAEGIKANTIRTSVVAATFAARGIDIQGGFHMPFMRALIILIRSGMYICSRPHSSLWRLDKPFPLLGMVEEITPYSVAKSRL